MVKVEIGDFVKFRKVKKIIGNSKDIYKGFWYKVIKKEEKGFYIKDNDGFHFYIAEDEFKYVKKIKSKKDDKNGKK